MIPENTLNVTLLAPREKHPTIFLRFDDLGPGENLIILNDHDPKPLYYQLIGERGNSFIWDYLEQGPLDWKVKITKRTEALNEKTLGQLAAADLRKAQVFKKFGLDFCCGGKQTLREACEEKGLDILHVEQELQGVNQMQSSRPLPYDNWALDFLADYIVNTHHTYVKKTLPDLSAIALKVMQVHSAQHPELLRIYELVEEVKTELEPHMLKEEKVLFPFIKELVAGNNPEIMNFRTQLGTVQSPMNLMEMEHELVGGKMADIRVLSSNYVLPEDACASYTLLYSMLEDFEEDLQLHIHLENNILFPKALELEKRIFEKA